MVVHMKDDVPGLEFPSFVGHGMFIVLTWSLLILPLILLVRNTIFALYPVSHISDTSERFDVFDIRDTDRPRDRSPESACLSPYISVSGPRPILCSAQSAPAISSSLDKRKPIVNFNACNDNRRSNQINPKPSGLHVRATNTPLNPTFI